MVGVDEGEERLQVVFCCQVHVVRLVPVLVEIPMKNRLGVVGGMCGRFDDFQAVFCHLVTPTLYKRKFTQVDTHN